MNKPSDIVIKAHEVNIVAAYLMEWSSTILKGDSDFYRYKSKQLLNQLIESNQPVLNACEDLRLLRHKNLVNISSDYGVDSISEEMDTSFELVTDFVSLYLTSSPVALTDLWIFQKSLLNGQRLYTQSDVDDLLKSQEAELELV